MQLLLVAIGDKVGLDPISRGKTGDDEHGDSNGLLIDFLDEHYGTCGGIILPPECKLEKLVQLEKSTELEHILQARFPGREHVRGSAHDVRVV